MIAQAEHNTTTFIQEVSGGNYSCWKSIDSDFKAQKGFHTVCHDMIVQSGIEC